MALLDKLLLLMQATPELSEIEVLENETVDSETFNFKVRAIINPNALQIRFLADKDFNRYSFQLYGDTPILRWDNTPHYPKISTHPHHFHNQDDNVLSSPLTGNLLSDYEIVISEIRKYLKSKKQKPKK